MARATRSTPWWSPSSARTPPWRWARRARRRPRRARAARPLRAALPDSAREIGLLIGPEGGFADAEVAAAEAAGFQIAGLGPRILRVETAAVVSVALAQFATGGLD